MRGLTMTELMVGLMIASVMFSLGVPSFQAAINNQRLTTSTNELVMSLNLAKTEAIKRVAYVTVCKSSNGATCTVGADWNDGWIIFSNGNAASLGTVDPGDEIIRVYPGLRDGISIGASGTVDAFLSFRPSGTMGTTVANLTGTMTVCDERGAEYSRGIVLEPSGRWNVSRHLAHDGGALSC